ncbi:GAF domain-containing sensor histidine kinase [Oerskovia turbata]|uniref:GAF domain-containing sensor histidine kinase n=1 Tax=Oerskovia turbata TaxID=1713 RepID=UPI00068E093B|nr:GAF domain-containing sensor histidine kinase [Oerskovia turbata]
MDKTSAEVQDAILRAVSGFSSDFDLRDLLVGVVRAACTLSGARYGALGVIGHSRRQLVEFVAEGMSPADRERIGHLPTGHGLLGHLIDHPEPLRTEDLTGHPASTGFPPGHPPMKTFLGVPVRVRGRVFGNLYLTEKATGPTFTSEDEKAIVAMAALAGLAIEHANLLVMAERRARWLEAAATMPSDVLRAATSRAALHAVLHGALIASQGTTCLAIAPDETGRFTVRATVGDLRDSPDDLLATLHPALMLSMATSTTRWADLETGGAVMTRLALDPLTRGAMVVVLPAGRLTANVTEDSDLLENYASQASLALERHHTRAVHEQLAVLAERDRIARDLHDVVIQRLFALGLQLKALSTSVDPGARERLRVVIDDLDATIGEIRRSIADLRPARQQHSLRSKTRALVAEYSHVLGYTPSVTVTGPLDTLVDPALHHHVLAVLREGLSNSARHAAADRVWLDLDVTTTRLTCTVTDDGTGIDRFDIRSGLRNLADRAAELGGTLDVADHAPHGCRLTWQIPLPTGSVQGEDA